MSRYWMGNLKRDYVWFDSYLICLKNGILPNEEIEVIDSAWMQIKVGFEKIKAQTTANKKYISNMLNQIADHHQEN